MKALKTVVFPIARILVGVLIAAALIKLAFFTNDGGNTNDIGNPGANFEAPKYTVMRGDITNSVDIAASVVADDPVKVNSTVDAYVGKWLVDDGAWVEAGTIIVELRREIPPKMNPNGTMSPATFTRHNFTAPISGTIKHALLVDQPAAIGGEVALIDPGTFSVSGTLSPEQRFRLTETPTSAMVSINSGPAPFMCEGITIGAPKTDDGNPNWGTGPTTTVEIRCPVPSDIRIFPGLTGTFSILVGQVTDVITVPMTAVQGVMDTGRVWVVDPATDTEIPRDITLGMSDGGMIEVTGGLDEGEVILQYAPGNMEPMPPGGGDDPWPIPEPMPIPGDGEGFDRKEEVG